MVSLVFVFSVARFLMLKLMRKLRPMFRLMLMLTRLDVLCRLRVRLDSPVYSCYHCANCASVGGAKYFNITTRGFQDERVRVHLPLVINPPLGSYPSNS